MHAFAKRTVLQVILITALAAVLRVGVLELHKIDFREAPYKQFAFTCDMGFFVLPVLLIAAFLRWRMSTHTKIHIQTIASRR